MLFEATAIGLVAALGAAVLWMRIMLRAPEFLYAARLCARSRRRNGIRKYWRKVVSNFVLVVETASNGEVTRVDMWCPHLTGELLRRFTGPEGGSWLRQDSDGAFSVKDEQLARLGPSFSTVKVDIRYDSQFGARIVATRRPLSIV